MKKALAILLSCAMLLTGCSLQDAVDTSSETTISTTEQTAISEVDITESLATEATVPNESADTTTAQSAVNAVPLLSVDTTSEEYVNSLGFTSLNDALRLLGTCDDERSSRYAYFADCGTNEAEKQGCSMGFAYHLRCDRSSWCI